MTERSRGLMFRKELPEGRGMLFDFSPEQPVSFWMHNTFIPLDMIFIRADGRILRIAENTDPHVRPADPVRGAGASRARGDRRHRRASSGSRRATASRARFLPAAH